jgi:hypothetical protein
LKSRRADTAAAEVSVKPPIVRPAPVTTAARLELNSNKMCPRSTRNTCVRTSKSPPAGFLPTRFAPVCSPPWKSPSVRDL